MYVVSTMNPVLTFLGLAPGQNISIKHQLIIVVITEQKNLKPQLLECHNKKKRQIFGKFFANGFFYLKAVAAFFMSKALRNNV